MLKEEQACVLTMSSAKGDNWLGTKLNRNPSYVTTDVHKAFIYAKPVGDDNKKCIMKMIMNADPHIDYIPQTLINWGLKNVIGVFIGFIQKKSENLSDTYKKLIEEKKEFYDKIRTILGSLAEL